MIDPSAGRDAEAGETNVATPRWVKAFAVVAVLLLLVFVVLLLVGGHGPRRHEGEAPRSGLVALDRSW